MIEKIEYEQVTINLPKAVMDFLRYIESVTGKTPQADIEWAIVDNILARVDSDLYLTATKSPQTLAEQFKLQPVFQTILVETIHSAY